MHRKLVLATAAIVLWGANALASENEGCTKAPRERWLSIEQLAAKLTEQGYAVTAVEYEDGCAEAKVSDKDGHKAELTLDPTTGAVASKESEDD